MKISDIPAHLGISAQQLADLMGVTKQALNNYTSGRKGKPSKFVNDLLAIANLNRVQIIFPDVFDHPEGESAENAAYWANAAIEALREAGKRGMETDSIIEKISDAAFDTLGDFNYEDDEN